MMLSRGLPAAQLAGQRLSQRPLAMQALTSVETLCRHNTSVFSTTRSVTTATKNNVNNQRDISTEAVEEDTRPGSRSQVHFKLTANKHPLGIEKRQHEWSMPNAIWSNDEVNGIKVTHKEPEEVIDYAALGTVRFLRTSFDVLAGFKTGPVNEHKYLNRIIFLETVAGIPGMVAGALRHLSSLRRMKRDHGWIHTLLEEAENERMHLLTFLKLKKPGPMFRGMVIISQGVMFNLFFLTYLLSPKSCHRFVGYIEEEAVHTYTTLLEEIDNGKLPLFTSLPAPAIAKSYWGLDREAMFRDVILAVRADEANHRVVNHTFADMHKEFKQDAVNPFNVHSRVTEYSTASGLTPPPSIASTTDSDDPKAKGTRTAAETITKADRVHVKPL